MHRSFARDLGALAEVEAFVAEFVGSEEVESVAFDLNLALEELFVNVVDHGGGTTDVEIELERTGKRVDVTLTDRDALDYDLTRHETVDVSAPLADREPGGLGIHLVRRVMDEVHYEHAERKTTIRLVKYLP